MFTYLLLENTFIVVGYYFSILFQNEGGEYDSQDIKTMLHSIGLVGKVPTDVLIKIHAQIKEEMRGNCFLIID